MLFSLISKRSGVVHPTSNSDKLLALLIRPFGHKVTRPKVIRPSYSITQTPEVDSIGSAEWGGAANG